MRDILQGTKHFDMKIVLFFFHVKIFYIFDVCNILILKYSFIQTF